MFAEFNRGLLTPTGGVDIRRSASETVVDQLSLRRGRRRGFGHLDTVGEHTRQRPGGDTTLQVSAMRSEWWLFGATLLADHRW